MIWRSTIIRAEENIVWWFSPGQFNAVAANLLIGINNTVHSFMRQGFRQKCESIPRPNTFCACEIDRIVKQPPPAEACATWSRPLMPYESAFHRPCLEKAMCHAEICAWKQISYHAKAEIKIMYFINAWPNRDWPKINSGIESMVDSAT